MITAAFNAMEFVLEFNSADRILILTDDESINIAGTFKSACFQKNCEVTQYIIKTNDRPLKEIPRELSRLLTNKTIVLNIMRAFAEEISFRIKWLFEIEKQQDIKCAHMPGITEDMMTEGPMDIDYREMKSKAEYLIDNLQNADSINLITEEGTELNIGIAGRTFLDDISIRPGFMGNFPCGEIYCAPEETKAAGHVIFNASIGDIGLLNDNLIAEIKNGKIIKFKSSNSNVLKKIKGLTSVDNDARVIGELGIGINPGARITGNMLEDEKAIGTAHIAFGNNEDFGGKNKSKIHRDFLINKPSIEIHFKNGGTKYLMKNGEII